MNLLTNNGNPLSKNYTQTQNGVSSGDLIDDDVSQQQILEFERNNNSQLLLDNSGLFFVNFLLFYKNRNFIKGYTWSTTYLIFLIGDFIFYYIRSVEPHIWKFCIILYLIKLS